MSALIKDTVKQQLKVLQEMSICAHASLCISKQKVKKTNKTLPVVEPSTE